MSGQRQPQMCLEIKVDLAFHEMVLVTQLCGSQCELRTAQRGILMLKRWAYVEGIRPHKLLLVCYRVRPYQV